MHDLDRIDTNGASTVDSSIHKVTTTGKGKSFNEDYFNRPTFSKNNSVSPDKPGSKYIQIKTKGNRLDLIKDKHLIQSRSKTSLSYKDKEDNHSLFHSVESKKKMNFKISKSKSKNELLGNDNVDSLLKNMKNIIGDKTKSIYLSNEDKFKVNNPNTIVKSLDYKKQSQQSMQSLDYYSLSTTKSSFKTDQENNGRYIKSARRKTKINQINSLDFDITNNKLSDPGHHPHSDTNRLKPSFINHTDNSPSHSPSAKSIRNTQIHNGVLIGSHEFNNRSIKHYCDSIIAEEKSDFVSITSN